MTGQPDELAVAKKRLDQALGDNFKVYLQLMKEWFKTPLPKEEFDYRAREFLPPQLVSYHNEFLVALFNKCSNLAPKPEPDHRTTTTATAAGDKTKATLNQPNGIVNSNDKCLDQDENDLNEMKYLLDVKMTPIKVNGNPVNSPSDKMMMELMQGKENPSSTGKTKQPTNNNNNNSVNKRIKKMKVNFDRGFELMTPFDNGFVKDVQLCDDRKKMMKLTFCHRERGLPDFFMSHLRMFVLTWESGLDGINEGAVKLVTIALREFMKNLLVSLFTTRSAYRLHCEDKDFKYAIGGPPINPYLKNLQLLDDLTTACQQQNDDQRTDANDADESLPQPVRPVSVETATNNAMMSLALSQHRVLKSTGPTDEGPVTMWHLFHTMKYNPSAIPMVAVYSLNINKVISRLSHPVVEDEGD